MFVVEEQAEKVNVTTAIIDGSSFTRKETKSYPGASPIMKVLVIPDVHLKPDIIDMATRIMVKVFLRKKMMTMKSIEFYEDLQKPLEK